ncbi:MAG: hypothetical protein ABGX16_11395 [Pirellulales bacterium]
MHSSGIIGSSRFFGHALPEQRYRSFQLFEQQTTAGLLLNVA